MSSWPAARTIKLEISDGRIGPIGRIAGPLALRESG